MTRPLRQQSLAGFDFDRDPDPPQRPAAASSSPGGDAIRDEPLAGDSQPEELDSSASLGPDRPLVYVVDSHSLIYQVFHAMPEMTGPAGQPVAAVHGFTRDVLDLIEKKRPDFLFCAFDHSERTFRTERYADYKVHREEMPLDLRLQIPLIRQMLAALGVATLEAPGYEADDILATVARLVRERGGTCYLVTSDKDCRQLLTDRVRIYNIRKDADFRAEELQAEWGIRPDQVVDFQALVGDPVDNVPGVPLIGPKLARDLLRQYGTLEAVLDHADEVSGQKRRENLKTYRDQALLSRDLVRLVDDVPIEICWRAGAVGGADPRLVQTLCEELGFRRLAERLANLTGSEPPPAWQADYRLIATPRELDELVAELNGQELISVDTETTSTRPRWAEIVGYSFAWTPDQAVYIPVRSPAGQPSLDPLLVRDRLREVLENPRIRKIGQNLKYDLIVLRTVGIELQGLCFDTMVADYLLSPGERNHSLDDLSQRYLQHVPTPIEDLIGSGKQQRTMDQVDVQQVAHYAAEDADLPLRLLPLLRQRLADEGLEALFGQLELPLIEVLAELEFTGIRVDAAHLDRLGQRFRERMETLRGEIYELAGGEFLIDSPRQLAEVLFQRLGLPVVKRTKTGPSTDVEVLEQLAKVHPLPRRVSEYRQFAKLNSTYVDGLRELVHPGTGRVHTSFKQDVAATGRLSSTEPNLQNIPVRTEEGREIRAAFLPGEPDWLLVAADYSQIELRVLAHFSGDPALQAAFAEERDIHAQVASQVFGVPLEEVTGEMRRRAKAVNFGVIYGQSPFGLARTLDIEQDEAGKFIDAYFERYRGVDEFIVRTLAECRQKGYVSTILGRRRAVQGVRDPSRRGDSRQRNLPERIAINTVIQGTAADLIKQAMIRVHGCLKRERLRTRMLLQIHDELVFEAPPDELNSLAKMLHQEMTGVGCLAVPLRIDLKAGPNWAACERLAMDVGLDSINLD
ncbi:MAG: DNA polymerase I [Pirellulaceae bacterium]|nr:DNA polymerase I [Pirellulaceae bacterium]